MLEYIRRSVIDVKLFDSLLANSLLKDAPKWRFELGTETGDGTKFNEELSKVEMPLADPVCGPNGPLMKLWV
jgi:hypothetical protein